MAYSMVHRSTLAEDEELFENESYLLAKEEDPVKFQQFSRERFDTFKELDAIDKKIETMKREKKIKSQAIKENLQPPSIEKGK